MPARVRHGLEHPGTDRHRRHRLPLSRVGRTTRRRSGGCSKAGVDAVTEVPADRWNCRAFYDAGSAPGRARPTRRWGGFVEGIDRFDPHFFGISPREAARMDPQQRLLLEVAWEALEDGGLPLEQVAGSKTAVFVGISSFDYSVLETSFRDRGDIDVYSNTGGSLSIAANRISYCFDLRGPSAAVDTACSSALVAVAPRLPEHLARRLPAGPGRRRQRAAAARLVRRLLPDGDALAGGPLPGVRRRRRRLRAQRGGRHGRPQAAGAGAGRRRPRLRGHPRDRGQPGRPHRRA